MKKVMRSGTIVKRSTQDRALYVKLRYFEQGIALTATAGNQAQYAFRGNDCYDPDVPGIGHQPLGFDQYSALYQRFTVVASKIKATFFIASDTAQYTIGIQPSDVSTWTGTDWPVFPMAKSMPVGTRAASNPHTMSHYAKTKKVFGTLGITTNTDDYSGNATSSPVKQWYWLLNAQAPVATEGVTITCTVKITYFVKFWQPALLTAS